MKRAAFTLTELLVVIAIVAILAGIALPVSLKIAEKQKEVRDVRNLHELGIGSFAYKYDHNDRIFSNATAGGWPSVLHAKYVTDWKNFKSPFDGRPGGGDAADGEGVPVSYGINANILAQSTGGTDTFDGHTTNYTSPSQLIYMAPNVDLTQTTLTFLPGMGNTNVSLNPPTRVPAIRSDNRGTHSGRTEINVFFADGHMANILYRDYATTSSADGSGQARWQPIHPK